METTSSADTVTDVAVDTDEPVTDDAAAAPPAATKKKRNSLIEWGVVIVIAALSAFLVRTFVVEQFKVVGQSMESTLHGGDRVLVNKLGYRLHDPRRGDVVVLDPIEGISSSDLIKRVIGLPGETVSMSAETCQVLVNGKELHRALPRSHRHDTRRMWWRAEGGHRPGRSRAGPGRPPQRLLRRAQLRPGRLRPHRRPGVRGDLAEERLAVAVVSPLLVG
ncbi:MAG: signal peptidase I [Ilumatobacteraceae bacterium]